MDHLKNPMSQYIREIQSKSWTSRSKICTELCGKLYISIIKAGEISIF